MKPLLRRCARPRPRSCHLCSRSRGCHRQQTRPGTRSRAPGPSFQARQSPASARPQCSCFPSPRSAHRPPPRFGKHPFAALLHVLAAGHVTEKKRLECGLTERTHLDAVCGSSAQPVAVGGEAQGVDDLAGLQVVQPFALRQIPQHCNTVLHPPPPLSRKSTDPKTMAEAHLCCPSDHCTAIPLSFSPHCSAAQLCHAITSLAEIT